MRYVLGPQLRFTRKPVTPYPPDDVAAGSAKLDPVPSDFHVDDEAETVTLAIGPYDLVEYNRLDEVRAYTVPTGTVLPGDADSLLASAFPFSVVDVSHIQGGASVEMPLPAGPDGDFAVMTLFGYEV